MVGKENEPRSGAGWMTSDLKNWYNQSAKVVALRYLLAALRDRITVATSFAPHRRTSEIQK